MHEALEALTVLANYDTDIDLAEVLNNLAAEDPGDRGLALAAYFQTTDVEHVRDDTFKVDGMEFLVLDDEDAEAEHDRYLEQLLDDPGCVPGADGPYFDRERWMRDAKMDGRGASLASYDGDELECGDYFAYRIG